MYREYGIWDPRYVLRGHPPLGEVLPPLTQKGIRVGGGRGVPDLLWAAAVDDGYVRHDRATHGPLVDIGQRVRNGIALGVPEIILLLVVRADDTWRGRSAGRGCLG